MQFCLFCLFQLACLFFNLRYYSFDILICNETYPKLIKLISSLIVLSFNHQNPQGGLDALSQFHGWIRPSGTIRRPRRVLEDIDIFMEGLCKPHLVDDLWQSSMTLVGLPEILCSACSNRSKCGGHVLVPLLHRLQRSRGPGLPILSRLSQP